MLMENGESVSPEDFSLDQDPLEYTKIFRGYKTVNRFNTIHLHMYSLFRILSTTLSIFPALGAHFSISMTSAMFWT